MFIKNLMITMSTMFFTSTKFKQSTIKSGEVFNQSTVLKKKVIKY